MKKELDTRRCGVLIHPTSFPSPFGIGDFGKEAREVLMMLAKAKVSLWQILPLGPTGFGDSPSGLWHHIHSSGQPFKNTFVRMPGPSCIENR